MLDKKEILKVRKDLLELHKRCLLTHFIQHSVKNKTRKKFFKLYDVYINYNNIQCFFFRDLELFIKALVLDRLDDISDYVTKEMKLKKKKR